MPGSGHQGVNRPRVTTRERLEQVGGDGLAGGAHLGQQPCRVGVHERQGSGRDLDRHGLTQDWVSKPDRWASRDHARRSQTVGSGHSGGLVQRGQTRNVS